MNEELQEPIERPEDKPGYGVDRTQIRALLELTPAERLRLAVKSSQNLARFLSKIRFLSDDRRFLAQFPLSERATVVVTLPTTFGRVSAHEERNVGSRI